VLVSVAVAANEWRLVAQFAFFPDEVRMVDTNLGRDVLRLQLMIVGTELHCVGHERMCLRMISAV
jgi:hypothetical protein